MSLQQLTSKKSEINETEPIGDRVLLKMEVEPVNISGMVINRDKDYVQLGFVEKLGHGELDASDNPYPFEIKEGDKVLIKKFAGVEIRIDGTDYLMVRYSDIEAIIHADN